MNCGNYGHLYCRQGLEEKNNNGEELDELEKDDENYIYNHEKKYYFNFNLKEDKKRRISLTEYEEEL